MNTSFYCDYNAGAPLRPQAQAAWLEAARASGNPSSVHGDGRRAHARLERAREDIAACLGARNMDIVFTSGATEAAHLALEGAWAGGVRRLAVSAIEHEAVFAGAHRVDRGCAVLPVEGQGGLDLAALRQYAQAQDQPFLLALMLVNNETGAIQPVAEAAEIVHRAGGFLLCDAAQGLGRVPVSLGTLGCDYLIASGHKLGAAPGAGFMAMACGSPFAPPRAGGGQEFGRRPGTENLPAIAALGAVLSICVDEREAQMQRLAALRDELEARLAARFPEMRIFAQSGPRVSNTSCFALPGLNAQTALIALDLAGVRASSGAACSSGKVRPSRVLAAMGIAPERAAEAIRLSFGWASAADDFEAVFETFVRIGARRHEVQGIG